MARDDETCEDSLRAPLLRQKSEPGLVVIVAAGRPAATAFQVGDEVTLGRGSPAGLFEDDDRISRQHVKFRRLGPSWHLTDLESRNGTFVNGKQLGAAGVFASPVLVRVGRSLVWAVDDVLPFLGATALESAAATGPILGGKMRRAWGEIALAGRAGDTLYVRGESGSGKELAARAFHEAHFGASSSAPFVAVNCAAIPEGLAERLLFGARKGAYSGATSDAEGYVQAAHEGTLFLDEIAELDPLVQAKLLRVLESREVLPLGAARPRKVEIRICAASHKNLRDEVAAGRFREDLYFRLGRPEVVVPPLRERLDEIPWIATRELLAVDARLTASVTLFEACALSAWPGNVREFLRESRRAGHRALEEGVLVVQPNHLSPEAGAPIGASASGPPGFAHAGPAETRPPRAGPAPPTGGQPAGAAKNANTWSDEQIAHALAENGGNVRGTARALGLHRNQLRRWLEKHPEVTVDPSESTGPGED